MKKIIIVLLFISCFIPFINLYNQTDQKEIEKIKNIEKGFYEFSIPNDAVIAKPEKMYPILHDTAIDSKVNILMSNVHYSSANKPEILKYMLLTNTSRYLNTIKVKEGRFFSNMETQEGDQFLSTKKTGEPKQIGVIRDFAGNDYVTIKPLKTYYEMFPVSGQYFVETSAKETYDKFVSNLVKRVNQLNDTNYKPSDFTVSHSGGSTDIAASSNLKYGGYLIMAVVLVLVIYYIFNESKRIGIIKMHGIANLRIWFILIGKPIIVVFTIALLLSILVAALFIKNTTYDFVFNIGLQQFVNGIIFIVVSLGIFSCTIFIKISDAVKNRKPTNVILGLNMLVKLFCSIILVLTLISTISQINVVRCKQLSLKSWSQSMDYGVFYPMETGDNTKDIQNNNSNEFMSSVFQIYPYLNKMGSVYVNARTYEEESLILNRNYTGIRSIIVNNNYLKQFPAYDENGKQFQTSEDTKNWILLVPKKYMNQKKEILDFFEKDRKGLADYQVNQIKQPLTLEKNQKIDIVWLANNQKIFAFNMDVFPSEKNTITDPIIQVITEKNSIIPDRFGILGGQHCTDPMKVKLIDRDPGKTLKSLEPELKRLKLDDNLKHLVTANQTISQDIYQLQSQIKVLLLGCFGLLIGLLIVCIQSIAIFFSKNKYKFIVRRLFGIGFLLTYKEYIYIFLFSCIIQIVICNLLGKSSVSDTIIALSTVFFIEALVSLLTLFILEKRNKVKILKGE